MRSVGYCALGALLVCGSLLSLPFSSQQAYANQVQTDAELLYSHVERLAKAARPPATESEFAAGVYVENLWRAYGYETELQPFYYHTYKRPTVLSLAIDDWKRSWAIKGLTFAQNGTATADIVDVGYGRANDFANGAARGKIALIKRGEIPFGEKVRQAAAAGAVAAIIWNDREGEWRATLGEPLDMSVPVIGLSQADGSLLQERLRNQQPLRATVKVDGSQTSRHTSYNFIATNKTTAANTERQVLLLANHDSTASSAGANDNASGVAVLLEVARQLAESRLDAQIKLVSLGAETAGERGGQAFFDSLAAKDKEKIVAAIYVDAVGRDGQLTAVPAQSTSTQTGSVFTQAGVQASALEQVGARQRKQLQLLAGTGIPAVLLTRLPAQEEAKDGLVQIQKEQLAQAAKVISSVVGSLTDSTAPAEPRQSVQTGRQQEAGEDLQ